MTDAAKPNLRGIPEDMLYLRRLEVRKQEMAAMTQSTPEAPDRSTLAKRLAGNNQTVDEVYNLALALRKHVNKLGEYDQGHVVALNYDDVSDLIDGAIITLAYVKDRGGDV